MFSLSRAPLALFGLLFASLVSFAPTASAATFWRHASEPRIIAIYHDVGSAGFDASSRLGDGVFGGEAITDRIRVIVDTDQGSRLGDGAESLVTLTLDPQTLAPAQKQALAAHRGAARLAAFHLSARKVSRAAHRIDYVRSELCGSDELRCEDHIVYKDDTVEASIFTITA